jgi:hypothetical protein
MLCAGCYGCLDLRGRVLLAQTEATKRRLYAMRFEYFEGPDKEKGRGFMMRCRG